MAGEWANEPGILQRKCMRARCVMVLVTWVRGLRARFQSASGNSAIGMRFFSMTWTQEQPPVVSWRSTLVDGLTLGGFAGHWMLWRVVGGGAVRGWDSYFFLHPAYWSRSHSKWRPARVSQWLPESMTAASHPRTGQWETNGKPPPTPPLYETHTINREPMQSMHSNPSTELVYRRRWPGRQWFSRKFPGPKKINETSADNVHQLRFMSWSCRLQTKVERGLLWILNPQFLAGKEKIIIYSWLFKLTGLWTRQINTANIARWSIIPCWNQRLNSTSWEPPVYFTLSTFVSPLYWWKRKK